MAAPPATAVKEEGNDSRFAVTASSPRNAALKVRTQSQTPSLIMEADAHHVQHKGYGRASGDLQGGR